MSILLGTGTGSFGAATNFGAGSGARSVASAPCRSYSAPVGDFNGDGHLDLAVTNFSSTTVSILLGTGSFGAATNFSVGSIPRSVAVGDFNSDGHLDVAVPTASQRGLSERRKVQSPPSSNPAAMMIW